MLTTNRAEWDEQAKMLRQHGISADAWKRYSAAGFRHYETIAAGYKQNMTDLRLRWDCTNWSGYRQIYNAGR